MTSNSEALAKKADEATVTINSPERSQAKAQKTQVHSHGRPQTERPTEPLSKLKQISSSIADSPIGNPLVINSAQAEGQLGVFYDRSNTTRMPTLITLNVNNIRSSVRRLLRDVIYENIVTQREQDVATMQASALHLSNIIARGVCVMLYMKLRIVNYHDYRVAGHYRKKPKVPTPFEVPQPYALAISQLGMLKLSGEVQELFLSPTIPDGADINFCLEAAEAWSPVQYSTALEQAKKLGLRTSTVDLTVKMGSSWWLYRPVSEGDTFALECPWNEENFTANTAVLATLFCNNATGGFNNPIVTLDQLGDKNVGTMLYGMTNLMSRNTYYAVSDESTFGYKIGI